MKLGLMGIVWVLLVGMAALFSFLKIKNHLFLEEQFFELLAYAGFALVNVSIIAVIEYKFQKTAVPFRDIALANACYLLLAILLAIIVWLASEWIRRPGIPTAILLNLTALGIFVFFKQFLSNRIGLAMSNNLAYAIGYAFVLFAPIMALNLYVLLLGRGMNGH
jgi:hypothetical protein